MTWRTTQVTTVYFKARGCTVALRRYRYGGGAEVVLKDAGDGAEFAVATVNIPDEPRAGDEVFVKNWGDNAGILEAREEAATHGPAGTVPVTLTTPATETSTGTDFRGIISTTRPA